MNLETNSIESFYANGKWEDDLIYAILEQEW